MLNRADYWFDDGSVLIVVQSTVYKLYRSLICHLSPRFFDDSCEIASVSGEITADTASESFAIRPEKKVTKHDFDVLIGYILHDITLTDEVSFTNIIRLYIVTSDSKLDFRKIHLVVEERLSAFMKKNPLDIDFSDYGLLETALNISRAGSNTQLQSLLKQALYYSYATHDDISFGSSSDSEPNPDSKHIIGSDATLCEKIMSELSEQFSPTLFQPPAALHMHCTDVYASLWMERAVQPAFADNGTANPFMTLKRLRSLDWKRETEGLGGERSEPCCECLEYVRSQWNTEAQAIWETMDSWLDS